MSSPALANVLAPSRASKRGRIEMQWGGRSVPAGRDDDGDRSLARRMPARRRRRPGAVGDLHLPGGGEKGLWEGERGSGAFITMKRPAFLSPNLTASSIQNNA
jgi:hypothetical protein